MACYRGDLYPLYLHAYLLSSFTVFVCCVIYSVVYIFIALLFIANRFLSFINHFTFPFVPFLFYFSSTLLSLLVCSFLSRSSNNNNSSSSSSNHQPVIFMEFGSISSTNRVYVFCILGVFCSVSIFNIIGLAHRLVSLVCCTSSELHKQVMLFLYMPHTPVMWKDLYL